MTIQDTIEYYKQNIEECWNDEKYKWRAVKHYKDNWNIDSEDFPKMLEESLKQSANLLTGGMYYASKMVCLFARFNPEKMRELFKLLYNENLPLSERLQPFRSGCEEILKDFQNSAPENAKTLNHYQDLRALCVYLSFEYPEKYFLFKYKMYVGYRKLVNYKESSQEADSEVKKYNNFSNLCEAVVNAIENDNDLKQMQQKLVSNDADCYSDPSYHLLAQTIIYVNSNRNEDMQVKPAVVDHNVETKRYWIYSPGERASKWDDCYRNGIMAIGWSEIGDLSLYNTKDEMKDAMKEAIDPTRSFMMAAHATWQFAHEMEPGDIVFAKNGMHTLIGRGVVTSDYIYDPSRGEYANIREVKWTHNGSWKHPGQAVMKTLTDITSYTDYVTKLNSLFESDSEVDEEEQAYNYPDYTSEDFLDDVYMEEEDYDTLVALVRNKKNVILQGAPGVGKTFAAKRLAYSMMGKMDSSRVMMIQFHQSYSYEDFIMGFRPTENGFSLKKGAFYDFCKMAEIDSDNEYFFIIDEINRGNLSKIFGELFMLIENDKRGVELQLLYSDEKFSVPSNVYIIGMMNTADRSLAMMDYALRRRFAFFEMRPGFETKGFKEYRARLNDSKFDKLISCVEKLNEVISVDESLGDGFCIGHSYFCNLKEVTERVLSGIVEFELIPLLKEYWFDEPVKVKDWIENLRSSIK